MLFSSLQKLIEDRGVRSEEVLLLVPKGKIPPQTVWMTPGDNYVLRKIETVVNEKSNLNLPLFHSCLQLVGSVRQFYC